MTTMSAIQLDDAHKAWSIDVLRKIEGYGTIAERLPLHIEAEKVSLLSQIAQQLAEILAELKNRR